VIAESLQEIILLHGSISSEREEQEILEWTNSCWDIEQVVHYHWDGFRRPLIAFAWKHTLVGDSNPMAKTTRTTAKEEHRVSGRQLTNTSLETNPLRTRSARALLTIYKELRQEQVLKPNTLIVAF
jgi:hypothetical protein